MALASESVKITISTIEISLKLQDSNYEKERQTESVFSSEVSVRSPRNKPTSSVNAQNVQESERQW